MGRGVWYSFAYSLQKEFHYSLTNLLHVSNNFISVLIFSLFF